MTFQDVEEKTEVSSEFISTDRLCTESICLQHSLLTSRFDSRVTRLEYLRRINVKLGFARELRARFSRQSGSGKIGKMNTSHSAQCRAPARDKQCRWPSSLQEGSFDYFLLKRLPWHDFMLWIIHVVNIKQAVAFLFRITDLMV